MRGSQSITTETLVRLGAGALAEVLLEHSETDAVLRKKLRMLLVAKEGAGNLSAELRKRIRMIGRSRSFVDWEKRKGLVQELEHLRSTIAGTLTSQDPQAAAELMWEFLGIADSVLGRVDDRGGQIEDVFGHAMEDLGHLCASLPERDSIAIARRVLTISDGEGFGASGALIRHMSEALGPMGRAELKAATEHAISALPKARNGESWQIDGRRRRLGHRLADLADLEKDVDGYIAALRQGRMAEAFAAEIAQRLIGADRPGEALEWLKRSRRPLDDEDTTHIDLRLQALEALGQMEEAQQARWIHFRKTLNADYLRAYLRRLPDFADFEFEQKAFDIAATHRSAETALAFFVTWPDLPRADRIVRERLSELEGGAYYTLRPAAEALEEKYPAAATRLYRRMVEDALDRASSKQYTYAARDLQSCTRLAGRLPDEPGSEGHEAFMDRLAKQHGRKHGFWRLTSPSPQES
jgi:hypothetical protein